MDRKLDQSLRLEFFCPFCRQFVQKKIFDQHKYVHWNDPRPYPNSIEELKSRFEPIGFWEER